MAKRSVVWTETAIKQRREILRYWTKRNGSTVFAEKLVKLVAKRIKVIEKHPESFHEADFPNTRESAFGFFSIYYRITEEHLISQTGQCGLYFINLDLYSKKSAIKMQVIL